MQNSYRLHISAVGGETSGSLPPPSFNDPKVLEPSEPAASMAAARPADAKAVAKHPHVHDA